MSSVARFARAVGSVTLLTALVVELAACATGGLGSVGAHGRAGQSELVGTQGSTLASRRGAIDDDGRGRSGFDPSARLARGIPTPQPAREPYIPVPQPPIPGPPAPNFGARVGYTPGY